MDHGYREIVAGDEPTNQLRPKSRRSVLSRLGFAGGLLVGAGLSALVPWNTLESVAPGSRLACVAGLGVGFVLFRILATKRRFRVATGAVTVALGGFLLSAGPHFSFPGMDVAIVEVGAVAFLCGLTLLFRSRMPSQEEREMTVHRLVNDVPQTATGAADPAISRIEALQCLEQSLAGEPQGPSGSRAARDRDLELVRPYAYLDSEDEPNDDHAAVARGSRSGGLRR